MRIFVAPKLYKRRINGVAHFSLTNEQCSKLSCQNFTLDINDLILPVKGIAGSSQSGKWCIIYMGQGKKIV